MKTYKFWYWLYNLLHTPTNWARNQWGKTLLKQTGQRAF